MLSLTRAMARQFRAVVRRLTASRWSATLSPFVLVRAGPHGLVLQARLAEAAVRYHLPGALPVAEFAFPVEALAPFEGRDDTPVTIEPVGEGKARACWVDGSMPQTCEINTVTPDTLHFPDVPQRLARLSGEFLTALAEASATASREPARLAVNRVLLRGKKGQVIGTDGRQMLIQGGFALPWKEDLLVPALPVFALRELKQDGPIGVGRTESDVALQIGPWTLLLAIDRTSRFPDFERILPGPNDLPTRLTLAPEDAALLGNALPRLPGKSDRFSPIILGLGKTVSVWAKAEGQENASEVVLPHSTVSGPPARLLMDRRYLHRAVELGFAEVWAGGVGRPLVCQDTTRTYLWMALDGDPADAQPPVPSDAVPAPATAIIPSPRNHVTMTAPQPDPSPPRNGAASEERGPSLDDLIREGEDLRVVLHEVHTRLGRLLGALKQQRRQVRAVAAAMASLRQFQHLGP